MKLTEAEKLVMKCIWDTAHDLVLSEVVTMVNERYARDWKPQTASTFLARLVNRKFLRMDRDGKIYTYHPLVSKEEYRAAYMKEQLAFWYDGDLEQMIEELSDI